MVIQRKSFWISPQLLRKIKMMQGKVQAQTGEEISLTKLSDKLLNTQAQQELFEQQILNEDNKLTLKFD